jgi:hypothetical protein
VRLFSGYLPPEKDPEYKNMVKRSLWSPEVLEDPLLSLPWPKDEDIVECPGKWPGERVLGKIRDLRFQNNSWMVDIIPLKEGITERIYCVDKTSKVLTVNFVDIAPVKAYFVRSENGYNITMKSSANISDNNKYNLNTMKPVLRAPSYRTLEPNFILPRKTTVITF